ncbi:MAG: transcriptional regulator [Bacteroidia bacterium]|nr:transcriptional regulator [Bacteroidia bacterium]
MENDIKKLEIITDYSYLRVLIKLFDDHNINGYTIIKDVMGKGTRGNKDGHGISGGFKNCYVMVCCDETEANRIADLIKPLLARSGGICIVTDAHWVIH